MTKEETPKPKRGRRSKAEIQHEFDILAKEESDAMAFTTPKAKEIIRLQEQEFIESVKDIASDEIVRKFADLNIEITKTLSSLSEKIVSEIETLAKLRQIVELEKHEISR